MKHRVSSLILFLLVLLPTPYVIAAEPPVQPTPMEEIQNSASYVTMKLGAADTIKAIAGTVVGLSIVGDVIPLVVKQNELNVTDMTPYNQWLGNASTRLYSETSKDVTIPYTKGKNRESAKYCAVLTIQCGPFPKIVKYVVTEPGTTQWSEHIPWTNFAYEYAEKMAAATGTYTKNVDSAGMLDYNREEQSVKHIATEDCGPSDEGEQNAFVINGVNSHAQFNTDASITQTIGETILNAVGEATELLCKKEVRLTKKLRLSNTPVFNLSSYNNPHDELTSDIINNTKTSKDGWTAAFVPEQKKISPTPYSASPNNIQLGGGTSKSMSYSNPEQTINRAILNMQQTACFATPQEEINNTFIGTDEKTWIGINSKGMCQPQQPEPEEAGGWNCRTDLPELASEQTNTQGKQWADNLVDPPCDSTDNAWEMCHNDVIDRASKPNSCYDPMFALTIWLHETGASNYQCTAQVDNVPENLVEDFGQHTAGEPHNFDSQITSFLSLSYANKSCPHTLNDWWSIFWFGACYADMSDTAPAPGEPTQKEQIGQVVAYTQQVYTMLSSKPAPDWPVICN